MNKHSTGLIVRAYIAKEIGDQLKVVGGQRDSTLNINLAEIDVSSKDDFDGWADTIGGQRTWDLSLGGAYVTGDEAIEILEDALLDEHTQDIGRFQVYLTSPSGRVRTGQAVITSFSENSPHTDLITYSISLNGAGPLRKIPSLPTTFTPMV